ncbi:MAG TPA: hypothetical protein VFI41_05120 [Gemmatimonadales bacterium]|nr:hypothetical protein [Gemmatimonadales bacterium]
MELGDRCEICGKPSQLVYAMVRLPDGRWVPAQVHIMCENNKVAKNRFAGMTRQN